MRRVPTSILAVWVVAVLLPAAAFAQSNSNIAGVVKDATGAVLPGVTVEAASPSLIEKVRTAVTDAAGQYKIIFVADVPGGDLDAFDRGLHEYAIWKSGHHEMVQNVQQILLREYKGWAEDLVGFAAAAK